MTDWPPSDHRAVYEVPRPVPAAPSAEERRISVATSRLRWGLPVSDAHLDEVLERNAAHDGVFTAAERQEEYAGHGLVDAVNDVLADAGDVFGWLEMCWIDGRRAVRVHLTGELEHYRALLSERVGADRIRVEPTALTEREIAALQERVHGDHEELAAHGILLSGSGTGARGFELSYDAWDQAAAERLLRERYGTGFSLRYGGASRHTFAPHPFASWLAEDELLHVFYALPHNGERPAGCQAFEDEHSVVVALTITDWRGAKTLVGGFTPSHATVRLERPLGDRKVIDDSANRVRPHWTEVPRASGPR